MVLFAGWPRGIRCWLRTACRTIRVHGRGDECRNDSRRHTILLRRDNPHRHRRLRRPIFFDGADCPAVRQSGLRAPRWATASSRSGEAAARQRELDAATRFLMRHRSPLIGWVGHAPFLSTTARRRWKLSWDLAIEFNTSFRIHLGAERDEEPGTAKRSAAVPPSNSSPKWACSSTPCSSWPPTALPCRPKITRCWPAPRCRRNQPVLGDAQRRRGGGRLWRMLSAGHGPGPWHRQRHQQQQLRHVQRDAIVGKLMALHHRTPTLLPPAPSATWPHSAGRGRWGWQTNLALAGAGQTGRPSHLDLDEIGWTPSNGQDIYTALVYAVSGMHVRDVMVAGNWLYRDSQISKPSTPARHNFKAGYAQLAQILKGRG